LITFTIFERTTVFYYVSIVDFVSLFVCLGDVRHLGTVTDVSVGHWHWQYCQTVWPVEHCWAIL